MDINKFAIPQLSDCHSHSQVGKTTCYLFRHKVHFNLCYMCQVITSSQTQNYIFLTDCYLRSEIVQIGGYYSQLIADYRLLKLKGLQISFRYYCLQAVMVSCPGQAINGQWTQGSRTCHVIKS